MTQDWKGPLKKIDDFRWEIEKDYKHGMRVPGLIYADENMLKQIRQDQAPEQVANVAFLPGIVEKSLAMPDIHYGYGFPIGGVAATSVEDGVISPGGVGFDINCLSGDTKILHEFGYTKKIKDFESKLAEESIKCANFGKRIINTKINAFMKFKAGKKVYQVTTESGKEITATEDHPFYTRRGMTVLENVRKGDEVAVFPLNGMEFSEPLSKVIVSEEDISNLPIRKNFSQTINELKKRDLLPLKMNNEKLPYLLKLMAFIVEDGTIYFTENKGTIWFYGESEDLETIREDIEKLGFRASKVYKRKRSHEIKTMYENVKFSRIEYSVKTTASSLAALLWAMGLPVGNKCSQEYLLPNWIFDLELWQKRLFLASLFGAELPSPSTVTKHGYNFYSPVLSMNKHEEFLGNACQFLEQIRTLLADFSVKASLIGARKEFINKDGKVSYRARLEISSMLDNLISLWSRVGFEYNKKRTHLANIAIQYLKLKKKVLEEREKAEIDAKEKKKSGLKTSQIYEKLQSYYVNHRFIERSLYEERKTSPRIAFKFPTFNEFVKEKTSGLGEAGIVWDKIVEKKIVEFNDLVYDFNVANEHHNFIANNFVVSNCGVRLLTTNLREEDVKPKIEKLISELFQNIPSGLGKGGKIRLREKQIDKVLLNGAKWAVKEGYGTEEDLEFAEEGGCLKGANPDLISKKAKERGVPQLGTLGAGNHFLEVQIVEEIYDSAVASVFGIEEVGQVLILIHTGSRGFGYQVCADSLKTMSTAVKEYGIELPDRQLACAPVKSPEGKSYFAAMACAANYAWANRQCITHWTRESVAKVFKKSPKELGLRLIYDIAHNIAKMEKHNVSGKKILVCVHRKGATRAFPAGHPDIPEKYRGVGQPVLIPGDMGRYSYIAVGTEKAMEESFGSVCHGAGRVMSRAGAKRSLKSADILNELKSKGIFVKAASRSSIVEEASEAYKDVTEVMHIADGAGISRKIAKTKPLGVIKG